MNKSIVSLLLIALMLTGCTIAAETAVLPTAVPTTPPQPPPTMMTTPTITPTPIQTAWDSIIAQEMQASFDFFWEQANTDPASPGFGLIRDRYPGSAGVASIAAVGFGLSAYPIGVEKGYITFQEGYDRANGTLDTLLALERTEGFYYHFLDMTSGQRAWQSEVSTIDTAILLMGVLTAGEYFGDEVNDKAQEIYDGVNWPWFVDESRDMFHMAYRPEKGFEGHWDFYAEQLMLYVLAAGSPTFPTDDTPYYTFTRHQAAYGSGQPFIHSWFGSLFTHQYSHAWLDFRGYTDQDGVNWFDNSVLASQAQVDFATAVADQYRTIGPHAWGLTACDGPDGYNGLYGAPPSGFDNRAHFIDDTVPPSGAIGSIIFLPEQAQQAMLHYAAAEGLTGRYGFLDAYNLSEEWIASDVIGINKGITLLMLANHENDLIHTIVMQNEHILNGLNRLHITPDES
ncbi:MAG: hypothetical protein IPM39_10930 [Chloroflexi bacterium]|nr:hypothetical protein [Chloroflexota bacterium]